MSPEVKAIIDAHNAIPKTYKDWKKLIQERGYSLERIRFDKGTTQEMVELAYSIGINRWERWVTKYEKESTGK